MAVKSTQPLAAARSPSLKLVRRGESFHFLSLRFLISKVDNWLTWPPWDRNEDAWGLHSCWQLSSYFN